MKGSAGPLDLVLSFFASAEPSVAVMAECHAGRRRVWNAGHKTPETPAH